MIEIIYALIVSNVVLLALVAYFWRQAKRTKARPESLELQEFLTDLLTGGSLIHVRRLAPADAIVHVRHRR